ncbi:MAG: hypothetical protein FJ194_16860 [Gammaproteobacteria bacterium]|nr:hypothetical protein [Gammaproteobacteria bacterium]
MTRNNRKTSWLGLLLLAACNSAPPAPESWLSATEADVLARFGKPSAELINDDHNRVIVFTGASTLMFGGGEPCDGFSEDACRLKGNLVLNQEDTGVRAIVARCSVFFEVVAGVVSKWTWGGRLCNRVFDSTFRRRPADTITPTSSGSAEPNN